MTDPTDAPDFRDTEERLRDAAASSAAPILITAADAADAIASLRQQRDEAFDLWNVVRQRAEQAERERDELREIDEALKQKLRQLQAAIEQQG